MLTSVSSRSSPPSPRIEKKEVPLEWFESAKNHIQHSTRTRVIARLHKLQAVINESLPSNLPRFLLDESLQEQICAVIVQKIQDYQGCRLAKKHKFPQCEKDVFIKTRTWWNRTKSSTLASSLFLVVCFHGLYQFLDNQTAVRPIDRIVLFIDVFMALMKESIKFPRTKAKPLIPHQCFLAEGEFKVVLSQFIQIFGAHQVNWDCNVKRVGLCEDADGQKKYRYIKEKHRSQNTVDACGKCLEDIRLRLLDMKRGDKMADDHTVQIYMQNWRATLHKYRSMQYDLSFTNGVEPTAKKTDNELEAAAAAPPPPAPIVTSSSMNTVSNTRQAADQIDMIGVDQRIKHPSTMNQQHVTNERLSWPSIHASEQEDALRSSMCVQVSRSPCSQRSQQHVADHGVANMNTRPFQAMHRFADPASRIHRVYQDCCTPYRSNTNRAQRAEQHRQHLVNSHAPIKNYQTGLSLSLPTLASGSPVHSFPSSCTYTDTPMLPVPVLNASCSVVSSSNGSVSAQTQQQYAQPMMNSDPFALSNSHCNFGGMPPMQWAAHNATVDPFLFSNAIDNNNVNVHNNNGIEMDKYAVNGMDAQQAVRFDDDMSVLGNGSVCPFEGLFNEPALTECFELSPFEDTDFIARYHDGFI